MQNEDKHPGGRPRKFEDKVQMQKLIDEYFDKCDSVTKDIVVGPPNNRQVVAISCPDPYDIAGLCAHLDCCRDTLLEYEKSPKYEEFSDTVKKAKLRIEANLVKRALKDENNASVSIFLLKNNYNYEDRQGFDLKHERVIRGLQKDQVAEVLSDEPAKS